ncbi:BCCT family transporter [Vibrio japonicus]|uniref:BCCT family transporter n=1 Tax=Vibrio japonicus TaxID=1824638 RepID=A0ABY5LFZ8_9VIBR|nr:BCCT family transporter [Vibrio japonicus]UUM29677.1 BCCT family transporter [Vibrio japonicus]
MSSHNSMVNKQGIFRGVNQTMTIASLAMVTAFVLFSVLQIDLANTIYNGVKQWITSNFGWYYIAAVAVIFVFSVWVAFSKFGSVRLGKDTDRPEFNNFTWFAMLFSAAVGTGLMFWSIAEPLTYIQGNPFAEMAHAQANTAEAAQIGMRITIFHWGLNAWSVYVLVGLILAYFSYRKGLPLTIRSALYPILGERIYGPIGHAVDLLAIFSTLFGTATTLGLGVSQMNAGLNYLFGIEINSVNQLILIVVVGSIATFSAVSGLQKGIKLLSQWNVRISSILFGFFIIAGPTAYLFGAFFTNMGDYLNNFIAMSLWVDTNPESQWQGWWTIFYWAWWLSWGPYVGIFIARISKGRTIRELMLGAVLSSTLGAFTWITIMGGTASYVEIYGAGGLTEVVNENLTMVLYSTIEALDVQWLTWPMAALATVMIISWFVTSADSATLVICTILSMGGNHPPISMRIVWGAGLGLVAGILLVAGGLQGLQAASIAAALPFSIVLIVMGYCLMKDLYSGTEYQESPKPLVKERTQKLKPASAVSK